MSRLKVLPYKSYSKSAKDLVNSLNPLAVLKRQTSPLKGKKVVLNWGNNNIQFNTIGAVILNKPEAVRNASNKLSAFKIMKDNGVSIPEYTHDINVAKEWIRNDRIVLCRKLLRANSGKGIVVAKAEAELVPAPLYVKYVRKEKEYRVHVFNGQIIDLVEKRRRRGFQESTVYNKYIRSYDNGWIFARDNLNVAQDVKDEALKAVRVLGLDFGAVDVVVNNRDNKAMVLEVNTAPGLQNTTLDNYKRAVQTWFRNLR